MDRQQIALKLAADGLGLHFKIGSFQDRLILQKAIYLVQAAGVHLGSPVKVENDADHRD
jgi:hypothetical protein